MSVRVMTRVWDLDLPDSDKIVLLALADCANDEGFCWPGMKSLVAKCSKTDRTIQAAIKRLCDGGHLTRRETLGKGCNYSVHPRSAFAPEGISPPKGTTQTPEATSGKPLRTIKASEAKASKAKRQIPKFIRPDDIPAEPWLDFVQMRNRIGKPMTEKAKALAVTRLRKLRDDDGWPPGDVLNHSTLNSYQGLFPPPQDQRHGRTNGLGRNQPNDGLSSTARAALSVFGDPAHQ